jgi:membrane peptidoglycan carboxypeptidase
VRPRSLLLSALLQRRKRRQAVRRSRETRAQAVTFLVGLLASLVLVGSALLAAFTYAAWTDDLPSLAVIPAQLDPSNGLLRQPTRLYDRTGQYVLAVLAPADAPRVFLDADAFSPWLVKATVALIQPDFFQSPGYTLLDWQNPDAHPTLAQELVFRLLLADEPPSPRRAVRERLLAAQLTSRYAPEQILAWYLNSTDYGHYTIGAEAAARLYLGKSAADLNLSEAALLTAIGKAPALNPFDAPQAAEANRIEVLRAMLAHGLITPAEANQAVNAPPQILPPPANGFVTLHAGVSPQFVDYLLRQLQAIPAGDAVSRGGMAILTSLDANLQAEADCALTVQRARLAGETASSPVFCESVVRLPALTAPPATVNGGVLILDPISGEILAAAGDLSAQPAGVAVTPFVYLTAFARGLNPGSMVWDLPGASPVLGQVYHGPTRLRTALVNDYLNPARTLFQQLGGQAIQQTAFSFGLDFPASAFLEEDFLISPFALTSAYGVFAAEGRQTGLETKQTLEPVAVLQVSSADGVEVFTWQRPQGRLIVSPQLAYLMNDVLSTAPADEEMPELGFPFALKVSATLDRLGAWAIGYTPERVVMVYLTGAGNGSPEAARGLWQALMETAMRGLPSTGWKVPSGVVRLKVCDPSGLLPTASCPNVVEEVFLEGRQPLQADTLYQSLAINMETGLLATVFTPPELVRSKVYLILPPEAEAWADSVGLERPPVMYDTYRPVTTPEGAQITAPAMFAEERGLIEIHGTAAGDDFVSYRLEYGAGLNPSRWFQIGEENTVPVTAGLLGRWDTSGLNGLYVLRLLVLRQGEGVDEALVQLTLDNTPPQVSVLYPLAGQEISRGGEPQVAIQAQVQEAFLENVVFYLDGEKIASLSTAPFGTLWTAKEGEHLLRVEATDRAGNVGGTEIRFKVTR